MKRLLKWIGYTIGALVAIVAVALAVAAHRRLPREGGSAGARTGSDRDRVAPLHRRDARRARAPRRAGPWLARWPADRPATRALRGDLADVAVLPQPAAPAAGLSA